MDVPIHSNFDRSLPQQTISTGRRPSSLVLSCKPLPFKKLPGILSLSCRVAQVRNQVIYAPSDEATRGVKPVFPAGTNSKVDMSD